MSVRAIHGSCLCGGVAFSIDGNYSGIGQCHCSKCRKVSGTASNAVFYTGTKSLSWTRGEELIREWNREDGWGSTFCGRCGSPLPRAHPNGKIYFVPAGVLDDDPGVKVVSHIFVGSKASWDEIAGDAPQHQEDNPALRR